jgi:HSP90 family molecular chaperone
MLAIRRIIKDMVDTIPEEKLKKVFEMLDDIMEKNVDEAWDVWEEFGKDAIEGKWEDASERHDFYLYGIK